MKVIAIGHQKRVGKNTFANFCSSILRERARGANIQVVNIANCLKDAAYTLYSGIGLEHWSYYEENPEKKDVPLKTGKTPRDYWLQLGSILTTYDSTIFIRQTLSAAKCDFLFLPDLRRVDETCFLGDYQDVIFLKMLRGQPMQYGDLDDDLLGFNFTHTVNNDGSLKDLHKSAETFIETHVYNRKPLAFLDLTK